jgi:stalled ribosome rescue protein Dom34
VARRLEDIVFSEGIPRIVLGGDPIVYAEFKNHLSERAWERVVTFERLDIRLPSDQAVQRALEAVLEHEAEEASDLVQQARDSALSDGLGTFGTTPVRAALEQGAVYLLIIDTAYGDQDRRETMIGLALGTDARVEFVEKDETLHRLGGVAALLRWRPDDLPQEPPMKSTRAA